MMADLESEILAVKDEFADKFVKKDLDGLVKVFTPDVTFMPPGMDAIHGREALKQQYSAMYDIGAASIVFEMKEVAPMDSETVYDRGYVQILNASGHTMVNGKYLVIWKKINGKWLAYIDIFNNNA